MGKGRFLSNNLITDSSMITVSSAPAGVISGVTAMATGSAVLSAWGAYNGAQDLIYTVEIDSVSSGKEVGQATYKWKSSESTGWEATGVATHSAGATLENNISIKFTGGTGDDFALGDSWSFHALRFSAGACLIDDKADTCWRATGCADESVTIDLGESRRITACMLGYHNLSAAATITLMGNTTDSFSTPAYSATITRAQKHTGLFLDESYRYWRLRLQDSANSDAETRVGLLYLGDYFEPNRNYQALSFVKTLSAIATDQKPAGVLTGRAVSARAASFNLEYNPISSTDADQIESIFENAHDTSEHRGIPMWFCLDCAYPARSYFGLFAAGLNRTPRTASQRFVAISFTFDEIARSLEA